MPYDYLRTGSEPPFMGTKIAYAEKLIQIFSDGSEEKDAYAKIQFLIICLLNCLSKDIIKKMVSASGKGFSWFLVQLKQKNFFL